MLAGFAETNRTPFDMPEADAELVQGFMTEYGGMRFGSFLMVEYLEIIVVCGVATAMFLGGWMGPGPGWLDPIWMLAKMFGLVFFFIWVRATLPRLRYDQLMSLGWKVLLPLATLNVLVTAVLVVVDVSGPSSPTWRPGRGRGPARARAGRRRRRLPRLRRDAARAEDDDGAADRGPDDDPVPGGEDAGLPALPRPPQAAPFEDTGLEKCVGCSLCAAACPADCIRVVAAENIPGERVSAGERYAAVYEINLSRCIFCGYCEIACPFDAITMGHDYEMADYDRET